MNYLKCFIYWKFTEQGKIWCSNRAFKNKRSAIIFMIKLMLDKSVSEIKINYDIKEWNKYHI